LTLLTRLLAEDADVLCLATADENVGLLQPGVAGNPALHVQPLLHLVEIVRGESCDLAPLGDAEIVEALCQHRADTGQQPKVVRAALGCGEQRATATMFTNRVDGLGLGLNSLFRLWRLPHGICGSSIRRSLADRLARSASAVELGGVALGAN